MGILRRWWFYPLAVVALLALLFAVLDGSQDDRNVPRETFVADARAGVVDRVWVAPDEKSFTYTTRTDSVVYRVDNPAEVPVRELLFSAGVEERTISAIRISQRHYNIFQRLLNLILTFLPLILIVSLIAYFALRGRRPRNVDPVCGTKLRKTSAVLKSTFQDVTYLFCSQEHKAQFDADPVRYLLKA